MAKRSKNKAGRPSKAPSKRASHDVMVRLNDDEFAKLDQWCTTFQVSRSEVMRRALNRARINPPLPVEHQKLAMDLGRIGNNMNQIAKRLHTLHGRMDVAEKYNVRSDVRLDEVHQIALDCQTAYKEALRDLYIMQDILLDCWDGVRGPEKENTEGSTP